MQITGQEQIASVFGVAPKTIVEWQTQGFPIAVQGQRGIASVYDTEVCITWYVQREMQKAGAESSKDRLSRLQGDKVEMELQQLRGDLVPQADVAPGIVELFVDLRNEFDQLADKYTDAIVAVEADPVAVHHVLKQAGHTLKEFCASYEYRQEPDQKGTETGL
jgi:Phage DNA packaging protein Nu1